MAAVARHGHRLRLIPGSMLAAAALALGQAAAAWACVPQARLVSLLPQASGPAGSQVTVAALAFDPGPAEVRWNAPDGPLLATAQGPTFSAPVTVPDVATGLYTVVVIMRLPDGGVGSAGTAAFEVTGLAGSPPAGPPPPASPPPAASAPHPEPASSPGLAMAAGAGLFALGFALGALGGARLGRRPAGE